MSEKTAVKQLNWKEGCPPARAHRLAVTPFYARREPLDIREIVFARSSPSPAHLEGLFPAARVVYGD